MAEKEFNWKGIKDNSDGTFTTKDKWAKNRLVREFHRQKIRVRSEKIGQGRYYVFPVGAKKERSMRYRPAAGYRPRTRVPRTKIVGPSPTLRQRSLPGAAPPVLMRGRRPSSGGIGKILQRAAAQRAERVRQSQMSPYTPEGKPRPGYRTYIEPGSGVQKIVKEPRGFFDKVFMNKQRREGLRLSHQQEQQRDWEAMEKRSQGPSTRIPEKRAPQTGRFSPVLHSGEGSAAIPERKREISPGKYSPDLQEARSAMIERNE